MTVTYPLTFPTRPKPSSLTFRPVEVVGSSRSPFTLQNQKQRHNGQAWAVDVDVEPMGRDDASEWIAFRLSLKGMYGTFLMGDPLGATPRGIATGTPLANTSGNNLINDEVLHTKGWTVSQTGILKKASYIQIGSGSSTELHMILNDADSDSSGNATFDIWPRLRATIADETVLTISNTVGLFEMASNEMPWSVKNLMQYGLSFTAMEALPIS